MSWNSAPPNHTGPGIIRILSARFLPKSEPNTLPSDMVRFLISVSKRDAIRMRFGPPVFTVTALGPLIWLAPLS